MTYIPTALLCHKWIWMSRSGPNGADYNVEKMLHIFYSSCSWWKMRWKERSSSSRLQSGKECSRQIKQLIECILRALMKLPFIQFSEHSGNVDEFSAQLFPDVRRKTTHEKRKDGKIKGYEKKNGNLFVMYEIISRVIEFFYEKLFSSVWIFLLLLESNRKRIRFHLSPFFFRLLSFR